MALLSVPDRDRLREMLAEMPAPVRLLFFTQTLGCETCDTARQVLDEVVSLSTQITLEEHNFILDKEKVAEYGIARVPAVVVQGTQDPGIRFYGAPVGYEFMSLLDAILLVSRGDSGLSEESRALIAAVAEPLAIQVFVTPT